MNNEACAVMFIQGLYSLKNIYHRESPSIILRNFSLLPMGAYSPQKHLNSSLFTLRSSLFVLHSSFFTLHSSLFVLHFLMSRTMILSARSKNTILALAF